MQAQAFLCIAPIQRPFDFKRMYSKEQSRKEYLYRLNRVIDYLDENIDEALYLDSIAELAHFSPFHFHRIFRAFTGETLNTYLKRIRLQKAGSLMICCLQVQDPAGRPAGT